MKMTRLFISLLACAAMLFAGCSSDDDPDDKVAVTGVSLDKPTLAIEVGDTETLTATIAPEEATDKTVTWSSDNETVATVDGDGAVTAVAEGTATVTVTTKDGGKTASCTVTVVPEGNLVAVTGVTLDQPELTLKIGRNATLTATVAPEEATDKGVTWSSDDETVATVDSDGVVTAVAEGTATVTVTTDDGGKTASCAVTVIPATITIYTAVELFDKDLYSAGGWFVGDVFTMPNKLAGATSWGITDIALSGGKLYAAGECYVDEAWEYCYWSDNSLQTVALPDGMKTNTSPYIAVSGSDVYVLGRYYNTESITACYWKNGVLTILDQGNRNATTNATAAAIADGKVYVAGMFENACCYWVDGERKMLPNPEGTVDSRAYTYGICVSDGTPYSIGRYYDKSNKIFECYWIGDMCYELDYPQGCNMALLAGIAVLDGKVYVGGTCYDSDFKNVLCCWVDGTAQVLDIPDGALSSEVKYIGVHDGKLCIAGYYKLNEARYICYWIDGQRGGDITLETPEGYIWRDISKMAIGFE